MHLSRTLLCKKDLNVPKGRLCGRPTNFSRIRLPKILYAGSRLVPLTKHKTLIFRASSEPEPSPEVPEDPMLGRNRESKKCWTTEWPPEMRFNCKLDDCKTTVIMTIPIWRHLFPQHLMERPGHELPHCHVRSSILHSGGARFGQGWHITCTPEQLHQVLDRAT
jgi:hypothetical protein